MVALVGYTNAGKSTLFNRLTQSSVKAQDLPSRRWTRPCGRIDLPSGVRVILSDTVGFIREPADATCCGVPRDLEEVLELTLSFMWRDIAHDDTEAQREDVIAVLADLGISNEDERPVIEALNKIDLLDDEDNAAVLAVARQLRSRDGHAGKSCARCAVGGNRRRR